jgi:hypothetical protein
MTCRMCSRVYLLHAGWLLGLLFGPEDGGSMPHRNVNKRDEHSSLLDRTMYVSSPPPPSGFAPWDLVSSTILSRFWSRAINFTVSGYLFFSSYRGQLISDFHGGHTRARIPFLSADTWLHRTSHRAISMLRHKQAELLENVFSLPKNNWRIIRSRMQNVLVFNQTLHILPLFKNARGIVKQRSALSTAVGHRPMQLQVSHLAVPIERHVEVSRGSGTGAVSGGYDATLPSRTSHPIETALKVMQDKQPPAEWPAVTHQTISRRRRDEYGNKNTCTHHSSLHLWPESAV